MKPEAPLYDLAMPFAYNGDKTIIPAETATAGRATQSAGFPPVTQIPIREGGVAPARGDFNGMYYLLSALNFWQQSGGMMTWKSTLSYVPPAIVYHNGGFWACVSESGPESDMGAAVQPGTDETYWQTLFAYLIGNTGTASGSVGNVTLEGDVTGSGAFDSTGNVLIPTSVAIGEGGLVPTGTIAFYAGSSVPSGWLICNGSTASRTTYADLYAVLGTRFGSGNGSTTFTLPDFRNRVPQGVGNYSLGTSISAAVPAISATWYSAYEESNSGGQTSSGAVSSAISSSYVMEIPGHSGTHYCIKRTFAASSSNSSYTGSAVQPAAIAVYFIIKT